MLPAALPALAPGFLLIVASLFGIWTYLPAALHWIALLLAAGATVAAVTRYHGEVSWPARREALARLEADGGAKHAPLQALEDRPFNPNERDPALWRAHLEDMRRRAAAARLRPPRITADARDPYGLRYSAVGLLLVALVAAGGDWRTRLAATLAPGVANAALATAADLWIEPPAYTGKAPVYLLRAGARLEGADEQLNVPQGSRVIAQINGRGRTRLSVLTPDEEIRADARVADNAVRAELDLNASGVVRLRLAGREGRWPVGVIRDRPPAAVYIEPPASTDDALLSLALAFADDYGVAQAALHLRLDPDQTLPLDAPPLDEGAIREARIIPLDGAAGAPGERRFDLDLQADPWAGLVVLAKVVVKDGAGQRGETEEAAVSLPERPFYNPLARAVIEQRRTLAVAEPSWRRVGRSFDALTLAPEQFYDGTKEYFLLRTAFWRVMRQDGDGFDDAVEDFWPLALQLEDEALELARRQMEAAQEALRQALERGAGEEEIARLVEALRDAINNYLQALAQSGQSAPAPRGPVEELSQSDIDRMLDSIRNLSQSGANNAARQMLTDLQNLLNNLRLAQRGGSSGSGTPQQGGEGGGAAGQAGDLIGRQRDLANRSFERSQEPGATGDDLAAEERGIAGDLQDLLDELGDAPVDENGDAAHALGDALDEMRAAEEALNADDFGAADGAMERAIENLRAGAEALAREAMRQAGEGQPDNGAGRRGRDPLGRPLGPFGEDVEVPGEGGAGRAREVIEELRRRLGEAGRSKEEIEYLERLLERF